MTEVDVVGSNSQDAFEDRWARFYAREAFSGDTLENTGATDPHNSTGALNRTGASSIAEGDEDDMKTWLHEFESRMSDRKGDMEQRHMQQIIQEGREMDAWHREHVKEAEREAQREAEEAEYRRQEQLKREQEELENAEQLRIDRETAGMTPRSKQVWIDDDKEMQALEQQLSAQEGRMSSLNAKIGELVGAYENRLVEEEQEAQRQEDEKRLAVEAFHGALRDEREAIFSELRSCVQEDFDAIAEQMETQWVDMERQERIMAINRARDRVYLTLSAYDLGRVDAAGTPEERAALLDELVEVDVLREKLKRQLGRAQKSE